MMRERAAEEVNTKMGRIGRRRSVEGFSSAPPEPGARLGRLLDWMAGQDFADLVRSGLLPHVERIVLEAHRGLYDAEGLEWSRPIAYRWLRYEDPMPVDRLREGVTRLRRRGASFSFDAVDKACTEALKSGFLS
jgi:hypothetical protein